MTDELQLIESAKNGDMQAFEALIENYKRLAASVAFSYYISGGDVLDLLSEGMFGLFKAVKSFDASKNVPFGAFAKLCITRQIQTAIKKANSGKNSLLNNALPIEEAAQTGVGNPEEIVLEQEDLENFYGKIDTVLTKLEKDVLSAHLEGESYDKISAKLGIGYKSVDNALFRIKKKLK